MGQELKMSAGLVGGNVKKREKKNTRKLVSWKGSDGGNLLYFLSLSHKPTHEHVYTDITLKPVITTIKYRHQILVSPLTLTKSGKRPSSHLFWEKEMAVNAFSQFTLCFVVNQGFHQCVVVAVVRVSRLFLWYRISCFVILWKCCGVLTCLCWWSVFVRSYSLM